jgi:hypothetical protein
MPEKSIKNNKKKISQNGGYRHDDSILKNELDISFPKGFPVLEQNGYYNIVHKYDPYTNNLNKISSNLQDLKEKIAGTYPDIEAHKRSNHNKLMIKDSIYRIYLNNKDELNDLVNFLEK